MVPKKFVGLKNKTKIKKNTIIPKILRNCLKKNCCLKKLMHKNAIKKVWGSIFIAF